MASDRYGKVLSSMLGRDTAVLVPEVRCFDAYSSASMPDARSKPRHSYRRNSLLCIVRTSRQKSCNQRVGCLPCSMARISDLLDVSLDKRKVRCCGQDVYRVIDSYRYISHFSIFEQCNRTHST